MKITQAHLLKAMEKEPALTEFGIGIFPQKNLSPEERSRKLEQEREALRKNLEHFRLCCQWLSLCLRRKTINHGIGTSYRLKHHVEKHFGKYVTNGSFIAAVIHLGIPYKIYPDSPNIAVALSSRLPAPPKG
jgi:hypothetical protein